MSLSSSHFAVRPVNNSCCLLRTGHLTGKLLYQITPRLLAFACVNTRKCQQRRWSPLTDSACLKDRLPQQSPVVTICTASWTFTNSTFCPHSVFMCFVWIWEQTAIISLYRINWLVFYNRDGVCLLLGTHWVFIYRWCYVVFKKLGVSPGALCFEEID